MSAPVGSDARLLRLADGDNVLIVTRPIPAGEPFDVEGISAQSEAELPMGFKVAAEDLAEGAVAVRYGMHIGRITAPVRRGELVHTHNLTSMYIRTHARGEE